MRRLLIGSVFLVGLMFAVRRFGPKLGQQAMKKCEEMMSQMGSDFPPKKMMERMQAMSGAQGEGCAPEKATASGATAVA